MEETRSESSPASFHVDSDMETDGQSSRDIVKMLQMFQGIHLHINNLTIYIIDKSTHVGFKCLCLISHLSVCLSFRVNEY